jgi:hypothetical protein
LHARFLCCRIFWRVSVEYLKLSFTCQLGCWWSWGQFRLLIGIEFSLSLFGEEEEEAGRFSFRSLLRGTWAFTTPVVSFFFFACLIFFSVGTIVIAEEDEKPSRLCAATILSPPPSAFAFQDKP